jgi:hypothetical protein
MQRFFFLIIFRRKKPVERKQPLFRGELGSERERGKWIEERETAMHTLLIRAYRVDETPFLKA